MVLAYLSPRSANTVTTFTFLLIFLPVKYFFVAAKTESEGRTGTVRENDQKLCYNKYMRQERITDIGAYHHVMNSGCDGKDIFADNRHKSPFLDYREASTKRMKIRIFAYCIMTLHITITTWFWKTPASGPCKSRYRLWCGELYLVENQVLFFQPGFGYR
jgi:hypothetical protein